MSVQKIGAPVRAFLLVVGVVICLGIYLTGLDVVHWLLFLPAVFFPFAAITGICPGLIITGKLFGAAKEG